MLYKLYLLKRKLEVFYIRRLLNNIEKHPLLRKVKIWNEIGNSSQAPCGVKYITLCCEGIKPQGTSMIGYSAPFEAYSRFIKALNHYIIFNADQPIKESIFFWRRKPELKEESTGGIYYITSRFCFETRELTEDRLQGKSWET